MRLKNLETFLAVVKCGSFRGAADYLHTTQPAISARIAQLEDELGIALFDRAKRKVVLNNKGYELLPYAERIIALNEELELKVGQESSYEGLVRLGTSETLLHTWVPQLLSQLGQRFPNLSVEMEVNTTQGLRNALTNGEIDIALLMGPVSEPSMRNVPLNKYALVWAASPKLNIASRCLQLADIAAYSILTYPRQTRPYIALKEALQQRDIQKVCINTSASLATILHLAVAGRGVTALPLEVMREQLNNGDLMVIDVDYTLPDLEFTVTYSPTSTTPILEVIANIAKALAQNTNEK
ncbi:LysR family transcriptional regulator [Spartinivicinus ruber]|uniref:LysR family transcriptional regulator n=1 Tax=Spartinivicinus ruber TaxID=2683272 RepID=UPI0013D572F5|nr:LysR family transcriptional regulator [Spartinivicinus ruber]